jgi:hypothetical protein
MFDWLLTADVAVLYPLTIVSSGAELGVWPAWAATSAGKG